MRRLVLALLLSLLTTAVGAQQFRLSTTLSPNAIGAGGQLTNIDIAADGTKVTRADTFGAWYYNPSTPNCGNAAATGCWQQLVTGASMPLSAQNVLDDNGVYEIRIAPSNTSHFYMYYGATASAADGSGCIYSSTNHGQSWALTGFTCVKASANDIVTKFFGPYEAIDPANENILYACTPSSGLFVTANGGSTFSAVSGLATPTTPSGATQGGGCLIAFDPTSAVISNVTQGIWVCVFGTGCYHSTNGGASFGSPTSGTPTTPNHLLIDASGNVWLTTFTGGAPPAGPLFENVAGTWSQVLASSVHSIAINPVTPTEIVAGTSGAQLFISINGGTSFTETLTPVRTATDIPWLAWTTETFMTNGNMVFDVNGLMWFSEGIGIWTTTPPTTSIGTTHPSFASVSAAIEQLVTNWITSPWIAGSRPVISFWDRPEFYSASPSVYPSIHGVANPQANAIKQGGGNDWCSSAPGTVAALGANESGISTDGGQTFTAFGSLPGAGSLNYQGGSIACSDPLHIVWITSGGQGVYCSSDGGSTWLLQSVTGASSSGQAGWNFSFAVKRQNIVADRVNATTFYAINNNTSFQGIYKTTDGCATWTQVNSGNFPTQGTAGFNLQARSVPGVANDLFITAGTQGSPGRSNAATSGILFYECSGSGAMTCTGVSNVLEVWAFGFGAPQPGGNGKPSIYIYGWVNSAPMPGIWRCNTFTYGSATCASGWTQLTGPWPINMDAVVTVEGDANTWGEFYYGLNGSGMGYGQFPFLYEGDLHRGAPANDNDDVPVGLNKAA